MTQVEGANLGEAEVERSRNLSHTPAFTILAGGCQARISD
ncbi:hypothetical protein OSCI_3280009 [Kamptonema sp. PCC 6506]|nr:hypothetical protein OSCI_3280009 [Kamptonema sp. PCC 6506]